MSLKTFRRRAVFQRPGRAFLTVASIVIGVGATVAITLVANTSRDAYKQMFATVIGKAQLEVVSADIGGFDGGIQAEIESIAGVKAAVPLLKQYSVLYLGSGRRDAEDSDDEDREQDREEVDGGRDRSGGEDGDEARDSSSPASNRVRLQLLGIDPERDHLVRDYAAKEGRAIQSGDEAMIDAGFAESLGIKVGQEVRLMTHSGIKNFTVTGLWEPKGGNTITQAGLVYIPIAQAHKYYRYRTRNHVDSIQLVLDSGVKTEQVREEVAKLLPQGLQVRPPVSETQLMKETLFATEEGLHLATLFCVLLACFIILNTFFMNVSERRRQLAILRAIGASRGQVIGAIIVESLAMGLVGTGLGVLSGIGLASVANRIITSVFEVPLPAMELTWVPFVLAPLIGFGMSFLGAVVPAWHAGTISPLEGLDRVSRADLAGSSRGVRLSGAALIGIAAIGLGCVYYQLVPNSTDKYFGVLLLMGAVFLYEVIVVPCAPIIVAFLRPLVGVEAELASRQILRHRVRTNLTAGVVFVAASTGIGLGYAILDNVEDVRQWYRQAIRGDFFIRAMIPDFKTGDSADLPEALGDDLRKVPGIRTLESISFVENQIGEQQVVVIAREFSDPQEVPFDAISGDARQLVAELMNGKVVIGSVLALRQNLKVGDFIELQTVEGPRKLEVAGITNDYLVGGLSLYIHRSLGEKLLGITGCDGYVAFTYPANRDAVQAALKPIARKHGVLLHTVGDIRKIVEDKVQGLNTLLWALVTLMFVVASFGVVNTLTMNVLEQTRELAILRIVAMTRAQTRRAVLCQAMVIGAVGVVPGVGAGIFVAWLINILMEPSIGHPIGFGSHPFLVTGALLGGLGLTVFAAWLPARRASNVDVVQALHYE